MKRALAILALAIFPFNLAAETGLTENEAIELLAQNFSGHSLSCMSFITEASTAEYFEIALREKHNASCNGDPATAPVLDRFRIDRASKSISKFDAISGAYSSTQPENLR